MSKSQGQEPSASEFLEAAKERKVDKLKQLIDKKIDVNLTDSHGNTALHHVLSFGFYNGDCVQDTETCLEILLKKGAKPNLKNGFFETPLDLVVKYRLDLDLAKLLIKYGATITTEEGLPDFKFKEIVERAPEVAIAILDHAVSFSGPREHDRKEHVVKLDWRHIVYSKDCNPKGLETKFLTDILPGKVDKRHVILMHPLVQTFLYLKRPLYWRYFGLIYFPWIIITLALYLAFLWSLYNVACKYKSRDGAEWDVGNGTNSTENIELDGYRCDEIGPKLTVMAYFITIMLTIGPLILEGRRLAVIGPKSYFQIWQNYILLTATAFVMVTVFPALTTKESYKISWQYPCAAIGMLLSSISIMIQLTPIPIVSIYLEMWVAIFRRIVMATLTFSPLIIGFYWSFLILLTHDPISVFQFVTMFVNSPEYEDLRDVGRGDFYNFVVYFSFSAFAIIVIIVLINFLIGLAVNDIQILKRNAKFANLRNQVRSYYLMDAIYGTKNSRTSITHKDNLPHLDYTFHPFEPNRNSQNGPELPQKLKAALLKLAREFKDLRDVQLNNNYSNRASTSGC